MCKVVSTALFGHADRTHYGGEWYGEYLPAFVIAHANLFPREEGWTLRIHYDDVMADNRYGSLIRRLAEAGLVEIVCMGRARPHTGSMLWRLAPVFEPEAGYIFSRDLDALPMPRDRACCESFIRSKCAVHVIHDNVHHSGIAGGMCGFHAPAFIQATGLKSLDDVYKRAGRLDSEWAVHGTDQNVLAEIVLKQGGPSLLEHRYSGWADGQPGKNLKRNAGKYPCGGLSAPVPDVGVSNLRLSETAEADRLAPFMGAAGYDHLAARAWWEQYGDVEISKKIRACEAT